MVCAVVGPLPVFLVVVVTEVPAEPLPNPDVDDRSVKSGWADVKFPADVKEFKN
jgi:hypothetical protein